jgi:hypothetical protein
MGYARQTELNKLEGIFLASVGQYHPRAHSNQPATCAGSIHVGIFGTDPKEHKHSLKPEIS